MTTSLSILILVLLLSPCGRGDNSTPTPQPQPVPTVQPTQNPTQITPAATPTPVPVPSVDLSQWVHSQGGPTVPVVVKEGEDAGAVINAADNFAGPGKLVIRATGRASFKTQVARLKHDTEWHGEFQCDTQIIWHGCVMLEDNTFHDGTNARIYGPDYISPVPAPGTGHPSTTIFMTYASTLISRKLQSNNITVKGFKFIGRQTKSDGGLRQTLSFGNCVNCASIENDFFNDPSIGVAFGATASEGTRAVNALVWKNKHRKFAAAAIALVNVDGAIVAYNEVRDPGRRLGEGGGISAVDIETNNTNDYAKNIQIFNNKIYYGRSQRRSVTGNAILAQNVYNTPNAGGLFIANNLIDGWEGNNDDGNARGLGSGLYFVGQWPNSRVVSNTVIRGQHAGATFHAGKQLRLEDNVFINCGGGGIAGWTLFAGTTRNTFVRNRLVSVSNITGSHSTSTSCAAGVTGNTFVEHQPVQPESCK